MTANAPTPTDTDESRDRIHVLVSSDDSGGELFRFEYHAHQISEAPANHVHDEQEERVEVVRGQIFCRLNETHFALRAGESFVFPPGIPHAVWNGNRNGSLAIGEFRPALRMQEQFEMAFGKANVSTDRSESVRRPDQRRKSAKEMADHRSSAS